MISKPPEGVLMTQTSTTNDASDELVETNPQYTIDTRPLCQGMPFVLTDAAHPRLVLKSGSHFLVMDQSADIPDCNTLGYGYYRYDTRQISDWTLTLNGAALSLLSSAVNEGYAGTFLYTNTQTEIPQQKITVQRDVVLGDYLWERIVLENFHNTPLDIELKMQFGSDFADMFEVRGLNVPERGKRMMPVPDPQGRGLFLAYRGLDDVLVETVIEFFGERPLEITKEGEVTFRLNLPVMFATVFASNPAHIFSIAASAFLRSVSFTSSSMYLPWRTSE